MAARNEAVQEKDNAEMDEKLDAAAHQTAAKHRSDGPQNAQTDRKQDLLNRAS